MVAKVKVETIAKMLLFGLGPRIRSDDGGQSSNGSKELESKGVAPRHSEASFLVYL